MSFLKKLFGGKSDAPEEEQIAGAPTADAVASTTIEAPDLPVPDAEPSGGDPVPSDPHREPDPAFGHILAFKARKYAELGDFAGLARFYAAHSGDDATLILTAVTNTDQFSDRLEEWGFQARDSAAAQLFCGENFQWRAWEARGGRLAKDVSGGQWEVFGTWLNEAEEHFNRARELNPQDAEPWYRLMGVLLGKSGASPLAQQLLDRVRERHPNHLNATLSTLTHTLKKWGGTHEEMYDFARRIHTEEPDGSPLHTVVPAAILERVVYYTIDNDTEGANEYLQSQETRNFLYGAYLKSSGSDALVETCLTPIVHNWFACAAIYSQLKVGRVALQKVGKNITERPWAYIGMPVWGHVNGLREDFGYPPV